MIKNKHLLLALPLLLNSTVKAGENTDVLPTSKEPSTQEVLKN